MELTPIFFSRKYRHVQLAPGSEVIDTTLIALGRNIFDARNRYFPSLVKVNVTGYFTYPFIRAGYGTVPILLGCFQCRKAVPVKVGKKKKKKEDIFTFQASLAVRKY